MNKFLSTHDTLDRKALENLKVLFALMALGGKSDREIARILGISNTTLSRRRRKLEQDGYIKEYTIIPNLYKMGLDVIVFTFASTTEVITPEQTSKVRELMQRHPEVLCAIEDQGLESTNWVMISVHKNYDGFVELSKEVQKETLLLPQRPHVETRSVMFRTGNKFPRPFSLRSLNALFQPEISTRKPLKSRS